MQAQQLEQHTSIASMTRAVGLGATKVAAVTDLMQGQMRDLKALSVSVADLGTGQTTLAASMADLSRKLDLLITCAPATRRPRVSEGTVVDLVSSGAPAVRVAGDHSDAPVPKQLCSDDGARSRSHRRAVDGH